MQRGLEACHKFHFHGEKFGKWSQGFSSLRRIPDIPWPDFDAKKVHERVEAVRDRLLIALATSVSGIASVPASKEIPDYLGQAYVMLADECYKSMASGEEALFSKLFLPFFAVSTAVQERLRGQLQGHDSKTAIVYIRTEPVEDLLAISGYALAYSELDGKNFWNLVKTYWDRYLAAAPDAASVVKSLVATISYRRSLFSILPRDIRRMTWTQDFMDRLRQRGLADDFPGARYPAPRKEAPSHPSAIIRTLARDCLLIRESRRHLHSLLFNEAARGRGTGNAQLRGGPCKKSSSAKRAKPTRRTRPQMRRDAADQLISSQKTVWYYPETPAATNPRLQERYRYRIAPTTHAD